MVDDSDVCRCSVSVPLLLLQEDDAEEEEDAQQRQTRIWNGAMPNQASMQMPGPLPAGFMMPQMPNGMSMAPGHMGPPGAAPAMPGMAMPQMAQDPQQAGMFMAAMPHNPGM